MKMRFWQKTYIFTLILFLICINAGVLSLTVYTHRKSITSAEDTAAAEQYYVASSFERDYADLAGADTASPILLMQSYGAHYGEKGLYIAFVSNGSEMYSSFPTDIALKRNSLSHIDINEKRHIVISAEICEGKFDLIFAKNVESLDAEFRSLMLIFTATSAAISLMLALILYFVLRTLSRPLDSLRKTTETIESGNFSATAEERGNDEFTALARSFNTMLCKINDQMSALEAEAERKQMLVDNMAHELRTPLTSIHGYAEFIEKANTDAQKRTIAAQYIMSEAERLQKISEILLDGAFIRGNEVEMAELELSGVLRDTAQKLSLKADEKGVAVTCNCEKSVIYGNETLLSMLFYNLTENAIKACAPGCRVTLACSGNTATVTDNGKGMTAEQLAHITEPFYRTDKSRSRAEGGAGLGLALCKQIAERHGAQMEFRSEPGIGTKIILTFTTRQ